MNPFGIPLKGNHKSRGTFHFQILLFRKSKTQENGGCLKRTMVEKNGESTPRTKSSSETKDDQTYQRDEQEAAQGMRKMQAKARLPMSHNQNPVLRWSAQTAIFIVGTVLTFIYPGVEHVAPRFPTKTELGAGLLGHGGAHHGLLKLAQSPLSQKQGTSRTKQTKGVLKLKGDGWYL